MPHALTTAANVIRRQIDQWIDRRFDRKHGTDTVGIIEAHALGGLGPGAEDAHPFVATPERIFLQALRQAVPDPEHFTFIDYGSGKGRTLLLASSSRFRQIIGVEFSPMLHRIAEGNIHTYRNARQRCLDVSSVHCDAADFELPDADLVLYFWTPFHGRTLDAVLEQIAAALARRAPGAATGHHSRQRNSGFC